MGNTLFDYISCGGKYPLFGFSATEELRFRTARLPEGREVRFEGETAVKCDDDLFLAESGGRLLLVEEQPDESLLALDAEQATLGASALPEALEGWETDLSFASGYVLTARFRDGKLTLSPSPEPEVPGFPAPEQGPDAEAAPAEFPLQAVETGEKRFLLRFPETGETVFFSARRFLFYAILRGRIVTGFAEIPPRE